MQEQPPAASRDRDVLAVREAESDAAGPRVGADDPVREAARVDDAVDDGGRAGDRPAGLRPSSRRGRSQAETQ